MKKYDLAHFKNLDKLKDHLITCYTRKTNFQLNTKTPQQDILEKIFQTLSHTKDPFFLFDMLIIDVLVKLIHYSLGNKNFSFPIFNDILSLIKEHLLLLQQQNTPESLSHANDFFRGYEKSKFIIYLRKIDPAFNQECNWLDAINPLLTQKFELSERERSQKNYAHLLSSILEKTSAPLNLIHAADTIEKDETSFLPSTEYPPHLGEPDNPYVIGTNRFMSFNPEEIASLMSKFSTPSLKKLFLSCFPWGITSSKNAKSTHSTLNENLLRTAFVFPPPLQMIIMQIILLCLDILGKACGKKGEKVLKNGSMIIEIIDSLNHLSKKIDTFEGSPLTELEERLQKSLQQFSSRNALLNKTTRNSAMKDFCQANEQWARKLLQLSPPHEY